MFDKIVTCRVGPVRRTSVISYIYETAAEHSTRIVDKDHPAAWRALNGLGLKAKEAATPRNDDPRNNDQRGHEQGSEPA